MTTNPLPQDDTQKLIDELRELNRQAMQEDADLAGKMQALRQKLDKIKTDLTMVKKADSVDSAKTMAQIAQIDKEFSDKLK